MGTLLSPSQECHPFTSFNLAHDLVVSAAMPLSAQMAATVSLAGKVLIDIHDHLSKREELEKSTTVRGLVLLLKLEKLKS
jgi:hypothetical protein